MKKKMLKMERALLRLKSYIKGENGAEGFEWATVLMIGLPVLGVLLGIGALFWDEITEVFNYLKDMFTDGGAGDIVGGITSGGTDVSGGLLPPG